MRGVLWTIRLLVSCLSLFACLPAHAADGQSAHIKASLITGASLIAQNGDTLLALDYTAAPGWHTYWTNAGDTGLPPSFKWNLPDGVTVGDIDWPTPKILPAFGQMSYGYEGRTILLIHVRNGSKLGAGETLPISAHVDFLVCADVCIPEGLDVSTSIKVGKAVVKSTGGPSTEGYINTGPGHKVFQKAMDAMPYPLDVPATIAFKNGFAELGFSAPLNDKFAPAFSHPQGAYFFPEQTGVLSAPAPQMLDLGANGFTLRTKAGAVTLPDGDLTGVLKFADGRAFHLKLARAPLAAEVHGLGAAPDVKLDTSLSGLLVAMGLAFLGGLILNLMPCVFPVLSMKLLSLSRAGHDKGLAQGEALTYGLGTILSFVTLAAMLQVAHSLGASLGWGFQLQSPYVVAVLSLVMLLVALNMSGLFEIGTSLQGLGSGMQFQKRPLLGAFMTGVLAVIVAAPCTAPFMATAIGVALAQGGLTGYAIFSALGLGFALPFIALTFLITLVPGVAKALPRPGVWMDRLKHALALLMYAAAMWLVWVFAQQVELAGLVLLIAALALVVLSVLKLLPKLLKPLLLIAGVGLCVVAATLPRTSKIESIPSGLLPHRDFHVETLAALRSEGKPVLVDLTAAWCVTCKVNERLVLTTPEFAKALSDTGTVYMVGDWTNQDAEISHYLGLYGRSGVPLYVYYGPNQAAPVVLPQILHTDSIVKALRGN